MSIVSKLLSKCVVAAVVLVGVAAGQTPDTTWYANNASASSFSIRSANQLAGLAMLVNRSNNPVNFKGKTITVASDIGLTRYASGYNNGCGWIPIGISEDRSFSGTFDGNGKKISGLYINDLSRSNGGLFGYLSGLAVVKNLGVTGANITASSSVGAIAGEAGNGSVINCYSTGTVTGANRIGGVVGRLHGDYEHAVVANNYSTCAVTGLQDVGGIVGEVYRSTVKNCVALNPSVKGEDDRAGRVIGVVGGSPALSNNAAFGAIKNSAGNTAWENRSHRHISGEDMTGVAIRADGTLGGRFTAADGWVVENGKLPAFGAAAVIPEHLNPINAQSPSIVTQPAGATVEFGASATHRLSVSASSPDGGTLSYQWFTTNSVTNNTGGTMIPAARSANYAVPINAIGKFYYYVVVTNTLQNNNDGGEKTATRTSQVASVNVPIYAQYPVVAKMAADTAVIHNEGGVASGLTLAASAMRGAEGETLDLTVTAASPDNGLLSYQWYVTDVKPSDSDVQKDLIEDETNATYAVPIDKEGIFFYTLHIKNAIIDNGDGGVKSRETLCHFELNVTINAQPPVIEAQPKDTTIMLDMAVATHSLRVMASSPDGGTLSYQWYISTTDGGSPIGGATNADYAIGLNTEGAIPYYVIVTNTIDDNGDGGQKASTVTSAVAVVTVVPPVGVLSQTREAPGVGPVAETAFVTPVAVLASGLAVGPNPAGRGGVVKILYQGNRIESGILTVYDEGGNFVRKLSISDKASAVMTGDNARRAVGSWDLADYKSRPVSTGSYLIKGTLFTSGGKRENVSITVGVR